MIKVSIIIPVYNVEKYLAECLTSILNQTLKDIEIICVNDGSTDRSAKILEAYKKSDSRIKVLHRKNGGQSSARNAGMKHACGKYVYFMDSDDRIRTDALQILYDESEKKELDVLYFEGISFWDISELRKRHRQMQYDCDRGGLFLPVLSGCGMMTELVSRRKYLVSVCLQFIRKRLLDETGIKFYEGIVQEDNLFTFQVMMHADRTECLNKKLFFRRIRKASTMTKKEDADNCRGYYICYLEILRYVLFHQKEADYALQQAQAEILTELLYSVRRVYGSLPKQRKMRVMHDITPIDSHLLRTMLLPPNVLQKIGEALKNKGLRNTAAMVVGRIIRRRSWWQIWRK